MSQGLSNPQTTQRLYISPKTASHHVSNLLAKLGVQNRAETARVGNSTRRDRASLRASAPTGRHR